MAVSAEVSLSLEAITKLRLTSVEEVMQVFKGLWEFLMSCNVMFMYMS